MVRKRIRFLGRVQGVGFRYKAYYLASARELTGWVRNEWDGSVLMEVQGSEEKIDSMLQALNQDRFILISHMQTEQIPVLPEEKRFGIRGY